MFGAPVAADFDLCRLQAAGVHGMRYQLPQGPLRAGEARADEVYTGADRAAGQFFRNTVGGDQYARTSQGCRGCPFGNGSHEKFAQRLSSVCHSAR